MRKFLFVLSGLFTIIALILSFQNIATSVPVSMFFEYKNSNLFVPMFLLFILGILAGFFLALAIKAKSSNSEGSEF